MRIDLTADLYVDIMSNLDDKDEYDLASKKEVIVASMN